MKVPVRQIAEAVERVGGNLGDVEDLVECFERLHAGLADANAAYNAGDEQAAERKWQALEAEFAKPLDDVVRVSGYPDKRDHLGRDR